MYDRDEIRDGKTFAKRATQRDSEYLLVEFWHYLRHSEKGWLAPIILTILALGALVFLGGTGIAPFIYTVF